MTQIYMQVDGAVSYSSSSSSSYITAEADTNPITTTTISSSSSSSSTAIDNNDSDADGLSDNDEVNIYRTNQLNNDTDGDRLLDGKEVNGWAWAAEEKRGCTANACHIHKTNPLNPDTDQDRNDDYYEYSNFGSNPSNPDQDNDELLDGLESGPNAIYHTSYFVADTDHDGFSDGKEVKMGTNPLNPKDHPPLVSGGGQTSSNSNNHPPVGNPQRVSITRGDTVVDIILTGTDTDGDQLAFFISEKPIHGTLGSITYTGRTSAKVSYSPVLGYTGPDSFTFWTYDGKAFSNTPVRVFITISP